MEKIIKCGNITINIYKHEIWTWSFSFQASQVIQDSPLSLPSGVNWELQECTIETNCVNCIFTSNTSLTVMYKFLVAKRRPFVRVQGSITYTDKEKYTLCSFTYANLNFFPNQLAEILAVEQWAGLRIDGFKSVKQALKPGRAPLKFRTGAFPSYNIYPAPYIGWFAMQKAKDKSMGEVEVLGEGIVLGIIFNGRSEIAIQNSNFQINQITAQIEDLHFELQHGESFEIPGYFIGKFTGDWDEASYQTHRYLEEELCTHIPRKNYPWAQYDSWAYGQEINEEQQLAAAQICVDLGIEVFTLDLGWTKCIGDFIADPKKFPRGLKVLADFCHQNNMRFGVHLPFTQASLESTIGREHPEWFIANCNDYFGASPLCIAHEPCREWITQQFIAMVKKYDVDYIVQDGEGMVKACHSKEHTHHPENSNYTASRALRKIITDVRSACPDLHIENCEDGACMITYEMMELYQSSIMSDNCGAYSDRQGIYGGSYALPVNYSARYMQEIPNRYTLYSAIFGGPLIFMTRVTQWQEHERKIVADAIKLYKEWREFLQIAKIIHLQEPSCNLEWKGWGWDAIGAVNIEQTRALFFVYHARGGEEEFIFKPRSIHPTGKYQLRFDQEDIGQTYTAENLLAEGIKIRIGEFSATMITLDQVSV